MSDVHKLNGWPCVGTYVGELNPPHNVQDCLDVPISGAAMEAWFYQQDRVYQDELDEFNGGKAVLAEGKAHVYQWSNYGYRYVNQAGAWKFLPFSES